MMSAFLASTVNIQSFADTPTPAASAAILAGTQENYFTNLKTLILDNLFNTNKSDTTGLMYDKDFQTSQNLINYGFPETKRKTISDIYQIFDINPTNYQNNGGYSAYFNAVSAGIDDFYKISVQYTKYYEAFQWKKDENYSNKEGDFKDSKSQLEALLLLLEAQLNLFAIEKLEAQNLLFKEQNLPLLFPNDTPTANQSNLQHLNYISKELFGNICDTKKSIELLLDDVVNNTKDDKTLDQFKSLQQSLSGYFDQFSKDIPDVDNLDLLKIDSENINKDLSSLIKNINEDFQTILSSFNFTVDAAKTLQDLMHELILGPHFKELDPNFQDAASFQDLEADSIETNFKLWGALENYSPVYFEKKDSQYVDFNYSQYLTDIQKNRAYLKFYLLGLVNIADPSKIEIKLDSTDKYGDVLIFGNNAAFLSELEALDTATEVLFNVAKEKFDNTIHLSFSFANDGNGGFDVNKPINYSSASNDSTPKVFVKVNYMPKGDSINNIQYNNQAISNEVLLTSFSQDPTLNFCNINNGTALKINKSQIDLSLLKDTFNTNSEIVIDNYDVLTTQACTPPAFYPASSFQTWLQIPNNGEGTQQIHPTSMNSNISFSIDWSQSYLDIPIGIPNSVPQNHTKLFLAKLGDANNNPHAGVSIDNSGVITQNMNFAYNFWNLYVHNSCNLPMNMHLDIIETSKNFPQKAVHINFDYYLNPKSFFDYSNPLNPCS